MEIGHPIIRIRNDRGREFDNVDVDFFYEFKRIKHKFSAPKTPQQNGVAKRKNKVLQELAIVMIHMRNKPMQLLAKANNILVILLQGFFLNLEQRRHFMNYELGENLTLNILGLLVVSTTYLEMGKTLENWIVNMMKVSS